MMCVCVKVILKFSFAYIGSLATSLSRETVVTFKYIKNIIALSSEDLPN